MNNRRQILNEAIQNIWTNKIKEDYILGKINSERALQASFYYHLRNFLDVNNLEGDIGLFVESKFDVKEDSPKDLKGYVPDLVLTEGLNIIIIIEIKYKPHDYPHFREDLEKLETYHHSRNKSQIYLSIDPNNGRWDGKKIYTIAEDAHYYFAAVARSDSEAFDENLIGGYKKDLKIHVLAGKICETNFSIL